MPSESEHSLDPKNHVASVVKSIRLLELFTTDEPELRLGTIIERGGLARTTTHRLLSTLELVGWIERNDDLYRLSLRVFRLAASAAEAIELRREARPVMTRLADDFGEDVYLVVPDKLRAVCVERIPGRAAVRVMALDVGKSLPLFAGAAPLALLAERESDLLPILLQAGDPVTPSGTILQESDLRAKLQSIRELGYALSSEDVTQGIGAIGAVIRDSEGSAVAAVSVGALVNHLRSPRLEEMTAALRATAVEISRRLGYSG